MLARGVERLLVGGGLKVFEWNLVDSFLNSREDRRVKVCMWAPSHGGLASWRQRGKRGVVWAGPATTR